MSEYIYTAYGLTWQMPFICPELTPVHVEEPDVIVRFGAVGENTTIEKPPENEPPRGALYAFPNVAQCLILEGNEIIIQPDDGAPVEEIRLTLLATCTAVLLYQRGLLPIHASVMDTPHGAVLFAGNSGFGKSTLLGHFVGRGYQMLSDDIAAIQMDTKGIPHVLPAYPQIKLWQDSADKLGHSVAGLRQIRPNMEKFALPTDDHFIEESVPLHKIYALNPYDGQEVRIEELYAEKKFQAILDHTWQKKMLKDMGWDKVHFQKVISIAQNVKISQINRPKNRNSLQEMADLIEEEMNKP